MIRPVYELFREFKEDITNMINERVAAKQSSKASGFIYKHMVLPAIDLMIKKDIRQKFGLSRRDLNHILNT